MRIMEFLSDVLSNILIHLFALIYAYKLNGLIRNLRHVFVWLINGFVHHWNSNNETLILFSNVSYEIVNTHSHIPNIIMYNIYRRFNAIVSQL